MAPKAALGGLRCGGALWWGPALRAGLPAAGWGRRGLSAPGPSSGTEGGGGAPGEPAIVHDHGEWVVINKPAGWHSTGEGGSVEEWLAAGGRGGAGGVPQGGLVHRLDLPTSGCLVAARTLGTYERLRAAFSEGQLAGHGTGGTAGGGVEKLYLALTDGGGALAGEGSWTLVFGGRGRRSSKVLVDRPGGRVRSRGGLEGTCAWALCAAAAGGGGSAARPMRVEVAGPGRRHQIRAGFAAMGAPLLGDVMYGGRGWEHEGVALHAHKVRVDGVEVVAPVPARMVWALCGRPGCPVCGKP